MTLKPGGGYAPTEPVKGPPPGGHRRTRDRGPLSEAWRGPEGRADRVAGVCPSDATPLYWWPLEPDRYSGECPECGTVWTLERTYHPDEDAKDGKPVVPARESKTRSGLTPAQAMGQRQIAQAKARGEWRGNNY